MASSPLTQALTALLTQEAAYVEKLAAVREVIVGLRRVLGEDTPAEPSRVKAVAASRNKKDPDPDQKSSKGDQAKARIVAALKAGPLATNDLAVKAGITKSMVGYYVRQMQADREVKFIGAGRASRVALPGTPAKEAP